jgi:phage gpG-like protein
MLERAVDTTPAMQRVAERWFKRALLFFASQGEGSWRPLAQATVKRWSDHPILNRTGKMKSRLRRDWTKRNAAIINDSPTAHFAGDGTTRSYSKATSERVYIYQKREKRGHRTTRRSAASSKAARLSSTSLVHEPSREFVFVDDVAQTEGPLILGEYILEGNMDAYPV